MLALDAECTTIPSTGFSTKLSSAGLVYKHFGRDIVAAQLGQPPESPDVETVYLAVYKHFMEAIDGIDNGGKRCRLQAACHHAAADESGGVKVASSMPSTSTGPARALCTIRPLRNAVCTLTVSMHSCADGRSACCC
jgi:Uncharacterised protein family (UPF0160)